MSGYHRCPKCSSDHMMDGAFMSAAQGARIVVGIERHPDKGRLTRSVSTQIHASICGSCGFVELYCNQPAELYDAYTRPVVEHRPQEKTV